MLAVRSPSASASPISQATPKAGNRQHQNSHQCDWNERLGAQSKIVEFHQSPFSAEKDADANRAVARSWEERPDKRECGEASCLRPASVEPVSEAH